MNAHLSERALATRWSISPRTLQRWRQDGYGPSYLKLGGRVVYPVAYVEEWEFEHRRGGSSRGLPPRQPA
jgi:hypothetical protein